MRKHLLPLDLGRSRSVLFAAAAAAAVPLVRPLSASAAVPAPGNWSLVFDDEFNGNALNMVDWNYAYPWSQHGLADDSVEEPANVSVGGGVMTFTALPQGQWYGGTYYNYTSGAVNTSGKLNFTYGYIEASQKFSSATGTWPAYWMLQNGWPPEIDVEEYPNGPSSGSNANSYSSGYHYTNSSDQNASAGPGITNVGTDLASGYNNYGVDWEPNSLTFYFNGNEVGSISGSQANIAQAAGMYLLLDMGVGGWPGEPPSGAITTASPATMETDWVRVWQSTSNTNNQVNWVKAGNDSWDDSSAWSGGIANQSNLTAFFGVLSTVQSNEVISWTGTRVVNGLTFQSNSNYTLGASAGTVAGGGAGIELTSIDGAPTGSENDTVNINGYNQSGQGTVTINAEIQVQFSLLTLSVNNYLNAPIVFNGDMIGPGNMVLTAGGMTINGNDQMTGNLTVQSGTLEVGSTGQVSAANEFLVAPGGTVKLDSGSAVVANAWMSIGSTAGGTGTLNVSGGSVTANTDFNIGDVNGSSGVVDITGGSINCTNFYLGKSGTATGLLVQTGGAIGGLTGSGSDWRIGGANSTSDSTAVGIYNLSGGTFSAPVNLQVGAYGHGTVNQTGGTVTVGDYLSIGRYTGGVGVYNMASGSGTLTANGVTALIVGEQGTGTLLVGGASTVNARQLSIAQSDGTSATGTVTQTGGTVNATTGVEFGSAAAGTATATGIYNLAGGTLSTPFVTQNALSTVSGTFYFNGGTLKPTAVAPALFQGVSNLRVQAGGAIINATGIHLTLGGSLTHDPALGATPDGGLIKTGFNTLTVNATQSYTGATNISAGTLQLSNVPSIPDLGEIDDLDASTLALTNGAPVTSLADSSPVKNNAAVTVAGDYPTFNAASLNGRGTINFNSSSQGLTTAANTGITGNTARTLFVIDRHDTGDAVNTQVGATASSADYGISDGGTNLYLPYGYNNDLTTGAEPANTWHLYTTVHNPGASTPDIGYVNGVQTTTGNLTLNTTNSPLQVGYRSGDGAQSAGDVAEVIVYDVALTAAQIQTVDQYLDWKWFGTPLPTVSNLLPVAGTVNISTAGATLDLNGVNQTIGALNGVSGSLVTLGTATLTINNVLTDTFPGDITGAGGLNKSSAGLLILSGTSTYSGPTNITGGSVTLPAGAVLGSSDVTVYPGTTLYFAGNLTPSTALTDNGTVSFSANTTTTVLTHTMGPITVGTGVTLTVGAETNHAARQVLVAANVTVGTNGTVNLNNNDLDLSSASLQAITNLVATGYNFGAGANWSGHGITSGTAAADTSHLTALGVIQNNQDGTPLYSAANHFDGTTPGTADVLVKYTYFGDANLDGKIDGSDYSLIDAGYASGGTLTGWLNGDFNYDGVVDGSDYALIDNAFNNQTTSYTAGDTALIADDTAQPAAAPAAVPEPASISLPAAAAALAARRSRRRRRPVPRSSV